MQLTIRARIQWKLVSSSRRPAGQSRTESRAVEIADGLALVRTTLMDLDQRHLISSQQVRRDDWTAVSRNVLFRLAA